MTALALSGRPVTECSALELAAAIRTGELRARDVVDEHISLIEAVNPRVNAIVATRFDEARAEAATADEPWLARTPGRSSRRCSGSRARSRSRSRSRGCPTRPARSRGAR